MAIASYKASQRQWSCQEHYCMHVCIIHISDTEKQQQQSFQYKKVFQEWCCFPVAKKIGKKNWRTIIKLYFHLVQVRISATRSFQNFVVASQPEYTGHILGGYT